MRRALRQRLERAEAADAAAAEERAWAVVREAAVPVAAEAPVARRRARARRTVSVALLAATGVLVATGAAAAPAEWALDLVRDDEPARTPLPAAGTLLVLDGDRLAAIDAEGRREGLGRWFGATWSPRGRFVVAWRGRELAALTPSGNRRWELRLPANVQVARWSPDGFRIALRTSDGALRIVNGDGTGPRQLARVRGAALAWRPGAAHTLAWVRPDGTIALRNVDTLASDPQAPHGRAPDETAELAFSAAGRDLLAWSLRSARVFDLRRGRATRIGAGRDTVFTGAAFAPRGRALALARLRRARKGVLTVAGEDVFAGRGALQSLAWAPDGSAIAASWSRARQTIVLGLREPQVTTLPPGLPQGWR